MTDSLIQTIEKSLREGSHMFAAQPESWAKCARHVAAAIASRPSQQAVSGIEQRIVEGLEASRKEIDWKNAAREVCDEQHGYNQSIDNSIMIVRTAFADSHIAPSLTIEVDNNGNVTLNGIFIRTVDTTEDLKLIALADKEMPHD